MPIKDLEVGTRLPFVILLEVFLTIETETFDYWLYYGRLFQVIGKSFLWKINTFHQLHNIDYMLQLLQNHCGEKIMYFVY